MTWDVGRWVLRFLFYWAFDAIAQIVCTALMIVYVNATNDNRGLLLCYAASAFCGVSSIVHVCNGLLLRRYTNSLQHPENLILDTIFLGIVIRCVCLVAAIISLSILGSSQNRAFIDASILSDVLCLCSLVYATIVVGVIRKKQKARNVVVA